MNQSQQETKSLKLWAIILPVAAIVFTVIAFALAEGISDTFPHFIHTSGVWWLPLALITVAAIGFLSFGMFTGMELMKEAKWPYAMALVLWFVTIAAPTFHNIQVQQDINVKSRFNEWKAKQ